MKSSSLIKGTITPTDAFTRFELPRLESQVKSLANQLNNGKTQLENYLNQGITVSAQGAQHKFTPEQIKELIPEQFAELGSIVTELEKCLRNIGFEVATSKAVTHGNVQVSTATTEQKGLDPIKTTTITPVSTKSTKKP